MSPPWASFPAGLDHKALAPLEASALEDKLPVLIAVALTEAMGPLPLRPTGLPGSFHGLSFDFGFKNLSILDIEPARVKR